mgnify:CR=1 FL=1
MQDMFKNRLISERLQRMADHFPVTVVSGARQVGKTTLLKQLYPSHDYVVFDPSMDIEGARKDPDLFLRNHPAPLILDEIQYAPELVAAIKRTVDRNNARPGQFILTGSQQWQVLKTLSESLAGRAVFLDLQGFSLQELSETTSCWLSAWLDDTEQFLAWSRTAACFEGDLRGWLWRGSLPGLQTLPDDLVADFGQTVPGDYVMPFGAFGPHTLAVHPGGVGRQGESGDRAAFFCLPEVRVPADIAYQDHFVQIPLSHETLPMESLSPMGFSISVHSRPL